jgi:hypothetical protein
VRNLISRRVTGLFTRARLPRRSVKPYASVRLRAWRFRVVRVFRRG